MMKASSVAGWLLAGLMAIQLNAWASSPNFIRTHALAILGEPKYGPDFAHFEYVNPNAPQGGGMVFSAIGTYDSFNRYAQRGISAVGSTLFYDSLLTPSSDEIRTYYPLIAEAFTYADDFSEVTFHINPAARHQDGSPITADDVVFSFNKFMTEGVPFVRTQFAAVAEVEALSTHDVRYRFMPDEGSRDLIMRLGSLSVLPESWWAERNFSEPLTEPPMGSGAYRVSRFAMGQFVEYERIEDYWARDLPSRRGTLNFDGIRYDYYRDTTVALEAFKAGEYDFRLENVARQWANDYTGRPFDRGHIITAELPHEIPQSLQAFVFNIENPLFADRRVRQALNKALDFEWMNRNLFFDQYARSYSYFQNTPYMASGLPSADELEILEPLRDRLPPEVFTEPAWQPVVTDGSGRLRNEVRSALALLAEAGWSLDGQRLVHQDTGERFAFEMLLSSPAFERVALNMQRNFERMGVDMSVRVIDPSQFTNRLRERDFDLILNGYGPYAYPSVNMQTAFHSDFLDSTWNTAGVNDPVIDTLIDGIVAAQENEALLTAHGHAFDRVARWQFYVIPNWHSDIFRIAYWDRFGMPEVRPSLDLGVDTWWYEPERSALITR